MVIVLALGLLGVCGICSAIVYFNFLEPPGAGAKAEAGYQRGAPIIKALERYHADNGSYPNDLQALVPDYLQNQQVRDWQTIGDGQDGHYEVTDADYRLWFNYIGPCMNTCTYNPDTSKWECGGFC